MSKTYSQSGKKQSELPLAEKSALKRQLVERQKSVNDLQWQFDEIRTSVIWRITKPLRFTLDVLKRKKHIAIFSRGIRFLKLHGFRQSCRRVFKALSVVINSRLPFYSKRDLKVQRKTVFNSDVTFSILVPLYNTPEPFLNEMILSVLDQTYAKWELCLADGSDDKHGELRRICEGYAAKDRRIRYRKLEKNLGISGNTNECMSMATGDYFALLDHDDCLHPAMLFEVMRAICNKNADFIYTDEDKFEITPKKGYDAHYKPDYAPDTLRARNYICHFTVFKRTLAEKVGGFRSEYDGSQDYDMVLRLTEQAKRIVHIPIVLYHWRAHLNSAASDINAKLYAIEAARHALEDHMARVGLEGTVSDTTISTTYRISYRIQGQPLVSIIIPNKDHRNDLEKCVDSIIRKTTYRNWEIIIVENGSEETETFSYYRRLEKDERICVVKWEKGWNYSGIINYGVSFAKGDYYLQLNNDTEVITPEWIEEMLMFAQRKDVGAVGTMLRYPDGTIQHAGVVVGIGGVAGHVFTGWTGVCEYGRACFAQNFTAVTGACMMVPKMVWEQVNGMDEGFAVAFNDTDLCMRIRKAGYLIVWTPFAELYHCEYRSRGSDTSSENYERYMSEVRRFQERWRRELDMGDPYYSPNLTLKTLDYDRVPPIMAKERIRLKEKTEAECSGRA